MANVTTEQFLLSCINNSDLTKIDHKKVAEELGLPTAGASNKRFSRWKTKVQAELADGAGDGAAGDSGAKDGSASPKKGKKTAKKDAAAADGEEGTPKPKKTAAKKTPAKSKKRKLDEDADEGAEAVKAEPTPDDDEI